MQYRDLPELTPGRVLDSGAVIVSTPPAMRCSECLDGPFSATRGDYFMADPDADVTCGECGGLMELGHEETVWVGAA